MCSLTHQDLVLVNSITRSLFIDTIIETFSEDIISSPYISTYSFSTCNSLFPKKLEHLITGYVRINMNCSIGVRKMKQFSFYVKQTSSWMGLFLNC